MEDELKKHLVRIGRQSGKTVMTTRFIANLVRKEIRNDCLEDVLVILIGHDTDPDIIDEVVGLLEENHDE